jgi:hypothetical protein
VPDLRPDVEDGKENAMRILVVILAALLTASAALAAPTGSGGKGATSTTVLKPDDLRAMSMEQMLSSGEAAVTEMNELVNQVLEGLSEAQKRNDIQRMNCVSDVLTTIKGLMRLSEQNALSLRERVIAKDRAGAEHEYVKLSIARNKVVELHAQSKGCGTPGGETVFEGAPVVDRVFDRDLPLEEGRTGLDHPAITIEPPPSASPYL